MLCFFFVLMLFSFATAQPPEGEGWVQVDENTWIRAENNSSEFAEMIANGQAKVAIGRTETGEEILEPIESSGTEMEGFMMSVIVREAIIAESQGKLSLLRLHEGSDEEKAAFGNIVGISESQAVFLNNQLDELGNQYNERMEKIMESTRTDSAGVTPEMLTALDNDISSFYRDAFTEIDQIVQKSLTPEQLNRIKEAESMMPSVLEGMIGALYGKEHENMNFAVYETLDLSEEQSDELAKIQEEYNAEIKRIFDEAQEGDFNKVISAKIEKIKKLNTATKSKMNDRLTAEQRERLAQIPEKYAAMIAKAKNESGQEPEDDSWKHAWKPGDPIPEGMKAPEQPVSRFPIKRQ